MVTFSDQVSNQKMALSAEILIFLDFFEKYLASGFAILPELSLKVVELNSALNSASNDTVFDQGHRAKISMRVRSGRIGAGVGEGGCEKFLLDDPRRKWYHSTQNLMLNSTQPLLDSTQVI